MVVIVCFFRVGLESWLVNLWAITVLVSDWLIPGPSRFSLITFITFFAIFSRLIGWFSQKLAPRMSGGCLRTFVRFCD